MLVEVKPIQKEKSWHGKTGKDSFTQPKVIEVLYNTATGKYATGLTEAEAKKYTVLMGVDLSDKFNPAEPHPYWGTQAARIKLENRTMIFNDEKPSDFVKIKNMKASQYVANSQADLEAGKYPEATHVIYDESEVIELSASKIERKHECISLAIKMSLEEKAQVVQILSEKSVAKRSQSFINVELDKIIERAPEEFLKYAKMDKQEVYIRATVMEAIQKNILTKEAGAIYYMGERLANSFEDVLLWFTDPQNSKMKVSILDKIQ